MTLFLDKSPIMCRSEMTEWNLGDCENCTVSRFVVSGVRFWEIVTSGTPVEICHKLVCMLHVARSRTGDSDSVFGADFWVQVTGRQSTQPNQRNLAVKKHSKAR